MRQLALVPLIVMSSVTMTFAQAAAPAVPDCADVARAVQDMMRQDARLRDWAQLARYHDANEEAKSKSAPTIPVAATSAIHRDAMFLCLLGAGCSLIIRSLLG